MRTLRLLPVVVVPLLLALAACGEGDAGPAPAERDLIRARVAGEYVEGDLGEARRRVQPLLEHDPSVDDLLWGAIIAARQAIADTTLDLVATQQRARELAERARERAPGDPRVAFVLGNLALAERDLERAEVLFREVVSARPEEPAGWLQLAAVLDAQDRFEQTEALYRRVRELELPDDSPLLFTANFKLSRLLIQMGREEEALALQAENDARKAAVQASTGATLRGADVVQLEFGALAELVPPAPAGLEPGPPRAAEALALVDAGTLALPVARGLWMADLDDDGRTDLLGVDASGALHLALQGDDQRFALHGPLALAGDGAGAAAGSGGIEELAILDADNDGPRELFVRRAGADGAPVAELLTLSLGDGPPGVRATRLPLALRHAAVTELDADGDVDLVGVVDDPDGGGSRLALLGNAGAGVFEDVSARAGLADVPAERVWPRDLDGDNDVDLLVAHGGALTALDNLRGLRFASAREAWNPPSQAPDDGQLAFADLDADGAVDLLLRRGDALLRSPWAAGAFGRQQPLAELPAGTTRWQLLDLDLDGRLDLLADHAGGVSWRRGPLALRAPAPGWTALPDLGPGAVSGDLLGRAITPRPDLQQIRERPVRHGEGDGRRELAVPAGDGVRLVRIAPDAPAPGASLELQGVTDNALGVDALVEWIAPGGFYARRVAEGRRLLLGVPGDAPLELVRVTWPNGIVSYVFDVDAGSHRLAEQPERAGGSCPFLYTFDGERWVFVSDVLGATPLGLPFAPGEMVPFDHEEAVKIEAHELAPVDGELRLAITEELREVTYLDLARLRAVDHPSGVEIQPDEGFVLPPFPPPGIHALQRLLPPARAVANRAGSASGAFADYGAVDRAADETHLGALALAPEQDVTGALATLDTRAARPFLLHPLQFQGLVHPWSLDLEFGATPAERAAIREAPRLRLVLTGWLQWGDASVNVAAAAHPHVSYEIPRLWRPSGAGWEALPKPVGFPAGKTKTLVIDVTEFLDRDDPRLRLTTTLELSWDRVALDVSAGDAPLVQTELPPLGAELHFRGVSQLVETGRADLPERFDWERLDPTPPWDQHPGRYTRYGEVLPLLRAVDDELAILGTGDAVSLRFDAAALPPLPAGWTRSWLLDLDGWAKDGDFNTVAGDQVLPLPFHAMTSYPPAAHDVEPDRAAWDAEWNTREARRLKPVLVER